MKLSRLLAAVLLLTLCLTCALTCSAEAAAHTSGDYTYVLQQDGTAEITGYAGQENVLQIPDQLDGHTVSAIGAEAFAGHVNLSAVYIPACVGRIGDSAFSDCKALVSVSIGDQIAFVDMEETCSETQFIATAAIGMGAADQGSGKFSLSESLGTPYQPVVELRAVMEEDTGRTQKGKPVIQRTFACRVDQFLAHGFSFQTITMEELDALLAWEEQTGIQVLYPILEDNTKYDANIWYKADKRNRPADAYSEDMVMTSAIKLDENGEPVRWRLTGSASTPSATIRVLNATYYHYQYGHAAVYPTLHAPLFTPSGAAPAPEGLTIGENAFCGCSSLTVISLPADTRHISETAFSMIFTYPQIIVPYGTDADAQCIGSYYLTHTRYAGEKGLTADADPAMYTSGDFQYHVLADQSAWIVYCTAHAATELTIPAELDGHPVTAMSPTALRDCTELTDVHIPAGLTELGGVHFTGITSLTAIHVAEDNPVLASMDGLLVDKTTMTLLYCPESAHLGEAYAVPDGIRTIGGGAFRWSNLLSIDLPDSVKTIEPLGFFWSPGLVSVTIPDSVTSIGDAAFYFCKSLTSIRIPRGVTVIEDHVFCDCGGLTSVELPGTITTIGNSAFRSCVSLTELDVPDSVTSIGEYAFASVRMTTFDIPDSIETIEPFTFQGCRALTEIFIPSSVRSIGDYAFYACEALESVTIQPAGIELPGFLSFLTASSSEKTTSIGEYAFGECYFLTSVTLPENVDFIADTAFNNQPPYSYRLTFHAPADSYAQEWCRRLGFNFEAEE